MTRSIEEIQIECAGLYRNEKGYWEWKIPYLFDE